MSNDVLSAIFSDVFVDIFGKPEIDAKRKKSDGAGYVYAIERADGMVKIGKTHNPEKRIRALSLQGGFDIKRQYVTAKLSDAGLVEALAHAALYQFRTIGEWFSAPFDVSVSVVNLSERISPRISIALVRIQTEGLNAQTALHESRHSILNQVSGIAEFDGLFGQAIKKAVEKQLNQVADNLARLAHDIRSAANLLGATKEDEANER